MPVPAATPKVVLAWQNGFGLDYRSDRRIVDRFAAINAARPFAPRS
jgi:hypothetical protein